VSGSVADAVNNTPKRIREDMELATEVRAHAATAAVHVAVVYSTCSPSLPHVLLLLYKCSSYTVDALLVLFLTL
jgi:hypothetical protein